MKADGGETPQFAPVEFNEKNDGGKNAQSAPEKFNEKNYGGRTPAIRHRVKNNVKGHEGRNPAIRPRDQAPRPLPGKIPPQALKSETKLKPEHEI